MEPHNKHVVCDGDMNCLLDDLFAHVPQLQSTDEQLIMNNDLYAGWLAQKMANVEQMRQSWFKHLNSYSKSGEEKIQKMRKDWQDHIEIHDKNVGSFSKHDTDDVVKHVTTNIQKEKLNKIIASAQQYLDNSDQEGDAEVADENEGDKEQRHNH